MALRNFDGELKDLEGNPVVENGKKYLVKHIVTNALLAHLDEDVNLSGKQKIELFSLATRVNEGGDREYTVDELAQIGQRVLKVASTIAYARVSEVIEREAAAVQQTEQANA